MDVLTWVLSAVLALVFLGAGLTKLVTSRAKLLANPQMGWIESFSGPQVKAIAALEVLGAIGVILPWLVDVARILTPIAAIGLALVMVGAVVTHLRRQESSAIVMTVVLFVLAVVVAALRFTQL